MIDRIDNVKFAQRSLRITRKQKVVFDLYTAGLLPSSRKFAVHAIASALGQIRRWDPDGVPISGTFIQSHFRGAEVDALVERRVITVKEFNREKGKSREFRLTGQFALAFLEAGPRAEHAAQEQYVDAISGEPSMRVPVSVVSDANRNPAPILVQKAIQSVKASYVNMPAMTAHVACLKAIYVGLPLGPKKALAASRYIADLACVNSVLAQGATPTGEQAIGASGAIWTYSPSFYPQRFGRVSELGGGMQNASRALKAAARSGVLGVKNYDMEAAQMRLLLVAMREADIEPEWIVAYLANPNAKGEAAACTGLSVDSWKRSIYAILMGARVPTPNQTGFSSGRIVETIREEVGDEAFSETYQKFYRYVEPLLGDIKRWHAYLEGPWLAASGRRHNVDGKTRISNAVGATVVVEDLVVEGQPFKLRARLASFVLTGMEAAVAHRLAHAHSQTGQVLSLEHDGLIVIGEIDDNIVEQAVREAGFPLESVKLVEKPFV